MFQKSEVLLCRGFQGLLINSLDQQFGLAVQTSSLSSGPICSTGLMVSCYVLLLFSSVKEYAGPELKEAALKENSLILWKQRSQRQERYLCFSEGTLLELLYV